MASTRPGWRKALSWRIQAIAFDLMTVLVRLSPVDWASAAGGALLRLLGPLSSAQRIVEANLRLAYPESSPAWRRAIGRAQWESFGRYMAEFAIIDRLTAETGRVEVVGAERLAAIARSGRPVVIVSGHFSNLDLMAAVILRAGIDCDVTYRAANNPLVDERIRASRRRYGVRLLAPKGEEGARDLIACMRRGVSIAMMNDQRYDGGVEAPFFGRPVATLPAGVRLAQRFGTFIQPISIQRTRGARFRCLIHDPIEVAETGDKTSDVRQGVERITAFIEACVRERPGEWWWMHRRWPAAAYAELEARAGEAG